MKISTDIMQDFLTILPAVLYEYVLYEDGSSEFLYMSPTAKEILGHPAEYFIKDTNRFWMMVHPDDVSKLESDDVTANKKKDFFISEIRMILPSEKQIWIQMSSRPTSKKKNNAAIWSGYIIDITARRVIEEERDELITSLKAATNEINILQGFIPICSYCHSIRDEDGAWDKMESYVAKHSKASFSHGICPKCLIKERVDAGLADKGK
ncbi:MAG: PAS domain-containing protein [Gammaproteobacteria bacterium]|nr:PAS domain-containing protein [Gammaproteobacteria bacterium]